MDYKKIFDKRKEKYAALRSRMDSDMDLYLLKDYKLTDYDGKEVKGVDNVTLASPKILADRVVSVISTANPISTVKGAKMSDEQSNTIERFINTIFYNANVRNRKRHILPIHNFCTATATLQGWVGVRCVTYKKDGLIIDIEPLDMRNTYWEMGSDGFDWAAYEMPDQTKAFILKKYGYEISGEKSDLVDFWTGDEHIVWTENKFLKSESHDMGVPFVIEPVSLVPQLGKAEFEDFGESIFATNRDLYPEANKQMSILQTLNSLYFRPPMAVLTEEGQSLPDEYPYIAGMLMAMRKGEGFAQLPLGDVTKSAPFAYSILNKEIQLGGLPYSEFGTLDFPLSAIAIEKLEGHRDQVFLPRLQTLSTVYVDTSFMAIDQYRNGKYVEEFTDEEGDEFEFKPADFDGKFKITFRMSTTSPEKSISNYTVAQAAKAMGFPMDMIYREILEVEDPQSAMDRTLWEQAPMFVPEIQLYRLGEVFTRMSENLAGDEAEQAKDEAGIVLNKFKQMMTQPQTPEMGMPGAPTQMPNLTTEEGIPEGAVEKRIKRENPVQNPMEEV
jgi:hypothetical protein